MPRRSTTRNRTNPNTNTPSQRRARREARANGRGSNAAYTAGARSVDYNQDNATAMRNAWETGQNVQTYTRSRNGQMSADGRRAGGSTWTYTNRDMDGNLVRQSGRSKIANRRQRDYDTRVGMNNISPRVIQRWLETGLAREVNGTLRGSGGMVIRQKADGSYSMGLATG